MLFDLLIDEGLDLIRALIYRYIGRDEPKRKGRRGIARRLVRARRPVEAADEVVAVEASEDALAEAPRRRGSALPWIIIGAVGVAAGIIVWQRMNANAEAPLVE